MYLVPNAFRQFSYSLRVRQLPREGARDGEEHPPEPIEGGLIVHWMTRVRGDFVMGDRLGELRATGEDEKSVELCQSCEWDVAGPSYEGRFLVLDTIGKAWIFSAVHAGPVWARSMVEAL